MKNDNSISAKPKLLLHICCAPCSTTAYEKLCNDFEVTVFWYNPNIFPKSEYTKRLHEVKKLSAVLGFKLVTEKKPDHKDWLRYQNKQFNNATIEQLSLEPEKGARCHLCYDFRLKKAFDYAFKNKYDFFTTSLTVSPHKDGTTILRLGKAMESDKTKFLAEDFKKQSGYQRSIELSKEYNLYRQNYCGCEFSIHET